MYTTDKNNASVNVSFCFILPNYLETLDQDCTFLYTINYLPNWSNKFTEIYYNMTINNKSDITAVGIPGSST
jgi:hypothetical protein